MEDVEEFIGFNSKLVRLEVNPNSHRNGEIASFNSKLVRLEDYSAHLMPLDE